MSYSPIDSEKRMATEAEVAYAHAYYAMPQPAQSSPSAKAEPKPDTPEQQIAQLLQALITGAGGIANLSPLQHELLRRNAECNVGADPELFAPRDGFPLPPFRWDDERRAVIRAELDARIARLYGLTRDELPYILDPQDVYGPDFPNETGGVGPKRGILATAPGYDTGAGRRMTCSI